MAVRALISISIILFCVRANAAASSEKRVALVIGNAAYENAATLNNPVRDAKAVSATLRAAGFSDVTEGINLSKSQFDAALKRFGDAASGADWAMIFFAGHGISVGGETYLLPIDAELARADHVDDEAVSLSRVRAKAAGAKSLRLVILDSCRNNPFASRMRSEGSSKRAVSRGLSRPPEPEGSELIAYATRENETADDGDGEHSPFTTAFLKHLNEPGLEVGFLFRKVRDSVLVATRREQDPASYSSLGGVQLYFREPVGVGATQTIAPLPSKPEPVDEAAVEWAAADKNSIAMLELFLKRHGESRYGVYARAQITELEKLRRAPGEIRGDKVKYALTEDDRRRVDATITNALENGRDGERYSWNNPSSGNAGSIMPGRVYTYYKKTCRAYEQISTIAGITNTIKGSACRQTDDKSAFWVQQRKY